VSASFLTRAGAIVRDFFSCPSACPGYRGENSPRVVEMMSLIFVRVKRISKSRACCDGGRTSDVRARMANATARGREFDVAVTMSWQLKLIYRSAESLRQS
jgi:hypothetical protein